MKRRKLLCLAMAAVMAFAVSGSPEIMAAKKSKKVKLNKSKITLTVGKTFKLKLKNNKKKVAWTTSKKNVATVTKNGKVTAKKKGFAKITAKVAKKKYICKVTVSNKKKPVTLPPTFTPGIAAPTAAPRNNIVNVTVTNEYYITVKLSEARVLTKDDFVIMTKIYSNGRYNKELEIDDISTTDNITYQIILDNVGKICNNNYVKVTIKNLSGTGACSYETVYTEEKTVYTEEIITKFTQGVNAFESYDMAGAGYLTIVSVTGLPEGLTCSVNNNSIYFIGNPKTSGTYVGEIIIEDEIGNRYVMKSTWLVGSPDDMVAAIYSAYGITDEYPFYFNSDIVVSGGSGDYSYKILEGTYCETRNAKLEGEISKPGTYHVKVEITDNQDTAKKVVATSVISVKEGIKVTGNIKDGLGKNILSQGVDIVFSHKDKANPYVKDNTYFVYADGHYEAWLTEGVYSCYAYLNGKKSSIAEITVNGDKMPEVDFKIVVYPVKLTCDDTEHIISNFEWRDNRGNYYDTNNDVMYLPVGIYDMYNSYENGLITYYETISMTVSAKEDNVANVVVTEKNLVADSVKREIKFGESIVIESVSMDYIYYKFIPEETREYSIYTQSDEEGFCDTYGVVMGEKGILTEENEGGINGHFQINTILVKGETYYVGVRKYIDIPQEKDVFLHVE